MRREELERALEQGHQIFARGATARDLYIVVSGRVRLIDGAAGAQRLCGPGDVFGELPAILGTPSPYTAEALEPCRVLVLTPALLNRLCTECPEFSLRLVQHLARRLAGDAVGGMAPQEGRPAADLEGDLEAWIERLVPVLLSRRVSGDVPAPVPGSLRDLANDAKLPLRAAYQALHYLLDRGFLQLVDDQLSVLEPDLLQSVRGA